MRSLALALAAFGCALALAPGAAADTLLQADPSAQNVTAYAGVLMWSRREGAGRYHLVQRVGGVVSDAPVASSRHPFDPDLGKGRRGRVVAAYERCRKGFRACDVYRLDVRSGRERKARGAARRSTSEFGASVWGSRYAFAGEAAIRDGLFTATGAHARFLAARPVLQTDLRGSAIAFATYSASERVQVDLTRIYVQRIPRRGRGRSCLVDSGAQGGEEGTAVDSPVLDGGDVYWHDFTAQPGIEERIGRARLATACRRRPPIQFSDRTLPVGVDSIAVDRGTVYYTQADYVDAAGVFVADAPPPRFAGG